MEKHQPSADSHKTFMQPQQIVGMIRVSQNLTFP